MMCELNNGGSKHIDKHLKPKLAIDYTYLAC
jgi:hypothetical protein